MSEAVRGERAWRVASVASTLRSLQDQLSDAPAATRRDRLTSELKRVLDQTEPSERKEFLRHLHQRFPSGSVDAALDPAPAATCAECDKRRAEQSDPLRLADRLVASLSGATPDVKAAVLAKLREGGVSAGSGFSPELERELRRVAALPDSASVDATRAFEVSLKALEITLAMYGTMKIIYDNLQRQVPRTDTTAASGSVLSGDMRTSLRTYVTGQQSSGSSGVRDAVYADMEEARIVMVATNKSLGSCGQLFWQKVRDQFDPAKLEDAARRAGAGKGIMAKSVQQWCWENFTEKWRATQGADGGWAKAAGQEAIAADVVRYVEQLVAAARRGR